MLYWTEQMLSSVYPSYWVTRSICPHMRGATVDVSIASMRLPAQSCNMSWDGSWRSVCVLLFRISKMGQLHMVKMLPPPSHVQMGTFCSPLVISRSLFPLHWPGGHSSTHRSPYFIYPTSLKGWLAKPVLTEHWNVCNEKSCPPKQNGLGRYYCLARRHLCHVLSRMLCVYIWWVCQCIIFIKAHEDTSERPEWFYPQPREFNKSVVQIMALLKKWLLTLEIIILFVFSFACACLVAMVSASSAAGLQPMNHLLGNEPPCFGHIVGSEGVM